MSCYRIICGTYLVISFVVLGWRNLVLNKYYRKMSDVDKGVPFKHLNRGALLWMVLEVSMHNNVCVKLLFFPLLLD